MNILIYGINISPQAGGGERLSYNLAKGLSKKGHTVFLSCRIPVPTDCPYTPDPFKKIIQVADLAEESRKRFLDFLKDNHIDAVINNCADYLNDTEFIRSIRKDCGFTLISNMLCSPMSYQSSYAYKNIRFPALYLRAWFKQIARVFYPIDTIRLKTAFDSADRTVFLSEHFIDDFKRITSCDAPPRKVLAIPNIRTYCSEAGPEDLAQKKKTVLLVARLNEIHKRVSYALRIWKKIMEVRQDWTFVVVGDGPQKQYYEKMVEKQKIGNVVFTGTQDPLQYYRDASIFMMTSVSEGIPMVLVDSSTFGVVPVVLNTFSSLPDIVEDQESGFIVPDGRMDQFAEKVLFLMDNPSVREKMALKAISMSRKFSEDIVIDKWNDLLTVR